MMNPFQGFTHMEVSHFLPLLNDSLHQPIENLRLLSSCPKATNNSSKVTSAMHYIEREQIVPVNFMSIQLGKIIPRMQFLRGERTTLHF